MAPRGKRIFRVKTGCSNCRKSRYKCDEIRPQCTRCTARLVKCEYPLDPSAATITLRNLLLQQPRSGVYPEGISPNPSEIDMFGMFRSETVRTISGLFNKRFWSVDVPRAAQTYPPLWHASLALAAMHQNEKLNPNNETTNRFTDTNRRKHYYLFALTHFNQSILHLKDIVTSKASTTGQLSYRQQEIVLMTNILYIGIGNMLEDSKQSVLHMKNLFGFVETVRFGQDANLNPRDGILHYKDLLALLLFIDGTSGAFAEVKPRRERSYAIPVHQYPSYTSLSEAYIGFQLTQLNYLYTENILKGTSEETTMILKQAHASFLDRLSGLEKNTTLSSTEIQDIATMRVFMRFPELINKLRDSEIIAERIQTEYEGVKLLDEIDAILEKQQMTSTSTTGSTPLKLQSVNFSFSLRSLISHIAVNCRVTEVFDKAIGLMKKWPYKEAGSSSDMDVALYIAKARFESAGLSRTLKAQQSGIPIQILHAESKDLDPCEACECRPNLFVCRDHIIHAPEVSTEGRKATVVFRSRYEFRNGFESQTIGVPW